MPRWAYIIGFVLLTGLHYRLWLAPGGIPDQMRLRDEVQATTATLEQMQDRNAVLEAEVQRLKTDPRAVEYYARMDLGMILRDETFFLIVH